jgi:tetratricopeptide (TPR) repeat protein
MRQVELGPYHPEVAAALDDLITLYRVTGRLAEVEPLLKRAVAIRQWHERKEPLAYGRALNVLAAYYADQQRIPEAIAAAEQARAVDQAAEGANSSVVAADWSNLGALYQAEGRMQDAKHAYRQSAAAWAASLEPDHPEAAETLEEFAALLRELGADAEAQAAETRAREIRIEHSVVAASRQ